MEATTTEGPLLARTFRGAEEDKKAAAVGRYRPVGERAEVAQCFCLVDRDSEAAAQKSAEAVEFFLQAEVELDRTEEGEVACHHPSFSADTPP